MRGIRLARLLDERLKYARAAPGSAARFSGYGLGSVEPITVPE
jgi:hypothetical protein